MSPAGVARRPKLPPASSVVKDGGADAMVGAAAADVAGHGEVDVAVARLGDLA